MSTVTGKRQPTSHRIDPRAAMQGRSPTPSGSGRTIRGILLALFVIACFSAIAYGSIHFLNSLNPEQADSVSTYKVAREDLLVTVTEDGNVESASNVDIKCRVAGGSSILWIVEDGKRVRKGEKLVELDASSLEDQINTQRIAYNRAKSVVIQAQKDHQVAEISVKEYLEGIFQTELENAETQIIISQENLRSSQNALTYTDRMFNRGYISELELESQQFSVKRAKLDLKSATRAKDVLIKYTKVKTLVDLTSQVETAKAAMESEQAAFQLEEGKLKRLETQLKNCTIVAPQDGMVVYANEQGRRGQQSVTIEEGAMVRDRQNILRLPDLSQMQVKVKVHETKVEDLERGMRARVDIQGREFQGNVTSIANQPEATSWFSGNVKEYATIVKVEGKPAGLRPGMTAEVEILVAHLEDTLALPVSAVVEQRSEYYCWVKASDGSVERRPLLLGRTNDQVVEVKDGVKEGDDVIRNPRAVVEAAREEIVATEEIDVTERFGDTSARPAPSDKKDRADPDDGNQPAAPSDRGRSGRAEAAGRGDSDRPDDGQGNRQGNRQSNRQSRPQEGQRSLMRYDTDGDQKVSKDEAPEHMRSFFDRVDNNGDGFIDKDEIEKMKSRFSRGGGGGPGGAGARE